MLLLLKQSSCLEVGSSSPTWFGYSLKKKSYSYFLLLYDGGESGDLLELGTGELCIKT